jgi:hypothetical protein
MTNRAVIHDFNRSLAASAVTTDESWWEQVYQEAFPGYASMSAVKQDGWAQRGGIDRVIVLKCGKTLTVDEKVREGSWTDILLEYKSSVEHNTPGWVEKDLACDYIAYAFKGTKRCYMLPFQQLRKAWIAHGRTWVAKFPRVDAKNNGYTTRSVAVPIHVLMPALTEASLVHWINLSDLDDLPF